MSTTYTTVINTAVVLIRNLPDPAWNSLGTVHLVCQTCGAEGFRRRLEDEASVAREVHVCDYKTDKRHQATRVEVPLGSHTRPVVIR